ncbi:MAG TPA: nucleotide sugar dehydrogenase [Verrucomicrobiae bacterium]|nr:nucleotide sugar dehydrogenase [Verrucomicrobiae bacterium]
MNIVVLGLWHLGTVTAACCARHFTVTGLDFDPEVVAKLQQGRAPLYEPGLDDALQAGLAAKRLRFTTDHRAAVAAADVLWLCYDTPVNDQDDSDVGFVLERLRRVLGALPAGALVLISSQLPVGTCRALEDEFPQAHFACSPENLRLGRALDAFEKADRVVVGLRTPAKRAVLEELFKPFTRQLLLMRTESAEMVKHALNSFLAASIAYINEVARLCEAVGADAAEVAAGLKSDPRIGPRAYLGPGAAFAGGTLARDVVTLTQVGARRMEPLVLIPAIKESNDQHRGWALQKLRSRLGDLRGRSIAVLGLVYTPNTDTLRRSAAVELCRELVAAGARVRSFDPAVSNAALHGVEHAAQVAGAVAGAEAVVVCTEWPQFREVNWRELVRTMRAPALVVDANRFLEKQLVDLPEVQHLSVGRDPAPAPAACEQE